MCRAYRLARLLCPRFPPSTELRLHIHGGSSHVISSGYVQDGVCGAFVELFDHFKVEFSFDDEHTRQGLPRQGLLGINRFIYSEV